MIRSPIVMRGRTQIESPESSTIVPRETEMTMEEAASQIEETSPMQTVLLMVLREMFARGTATTFAESIRQYEMCKSVNCKRGYATPQNS